MSVVNDYIELARSPQGFEPSRSGNELGDGNEGGLLIGAEFYGGRVDCEYVVGIVSAYEPCPYLAAVNAQQHPVEALFDDARAVVGSPAAGIVNLAGGGVLEHHLAVAVIIVADGDSPASQGVEEELLAPEVLGEAAVVV